MGLPSLLSAADLRIILEALREKYGHGYSKDKAVGTLQAKLSILFEVETRKEARERDTKR